MNQENNVMEIDLLKIALALVKRVWIIIICAILGGGVAFSLSYIFVEPTYKAKTQLYVNNNGLSVGNTSFNISTSALSAAQELVNTYIVILKTRTTLNEVIDYAGVDMRPEELKGMITASAVNSTEIFEVTVETTDPALSEVLANSVAKVLPNRIAEIVDGSSVRIVDYAILPTGRSSPSYSRVTMIGMVVGIMLSAGLIVLRELLDRVIRDESYLSQTYNIPILASIPDAESHKSNSYYYYSSSSENK